MRISARCPQYALVAAVITLVLIGAGCGSTSGSAPVLDRTPAPVIGAPVESRSDDTRPKRVATRSAAPAVSTTADKKQASTPSGATRVVTATRDRPYRKGDWRPEYYTVRKGDTLYSIALDYGHDYRDLAAWNNLADAAYIQVGQRLRLFPPGNQAAASTAKAATAAAPAAGNKRPPSVSVPSFSDPKAYRSAYSEQALADVRRALAGEAETTVVATAPPKPAATPSPTASTPVVRQAPAPTTSTPEPAVSAGDEKLKWEWPAPGELLYGFAEGPIKKGLGIKGEPGQSVVSSAPGKVVYSGSGLRGYGNLIIVKHNATYLSVYAHNKQLLVSEGQMVAQGQKIAVMGEISSGSTGLHFEIRRLGKPMDPLKLLPERRS